jgi:hypothetical protein
MCDYIKGCNLVVQLNVVKVACRLYMSVGTRYMGGYPPQPQLHTWAKHCKNMLTIVNNFPFPYFPWGRRHEAC